MQQGDTIQYQKKSMDRLFRKYVTPQIKEIYHPELIQEWRLNIDAAEYEKNMAKSHLPSHKKVLIILNTGLCKLNQLFGGLLFMPLWNILEI